MDEHPKRVKLMVAASPHALAFTFRDSEPSGHIGCALGITIHSTLESPRFPHRALSVELFSPLSLFFCCLSHQGGETHYRRLVFYLLWLGPSSQNVSSSHSKPALPLAQECGTLSAERSRT